MILKNLMKNWQAKKRFMDPWPVKKLMIKVWNKSEMKTAKYYHYLYLWCDVLLLADILEKFKNNSLKNYRLCPSHYSSTPALSWNAMLNMTKVELELILDLDMYLFFEKGISGPVSYIFLHFTVSYI